MHSKVYFQLTKEQIAGKYLEVTAGVFRGLTAATFDKPVFVVDSPALFNDTTGTDTYYTLGLTPGAIEIQEFALRPYFWDNMDNHNTTFNAKTEAAHKLGIKGMAFSDSVANPTDAQLLATAQWTKVAASYKDGPGVLLESAAA